MQRFYLCLNLCPYYGKNFHLSFLAKYKHWWFYSDMCMFFICLYCFKLEITAMSKANHIRMLSFTIFFMTYHQHNYAHFGKVQLIIGDGRPHTYVFVAPLSQLDADSIVVVSPIAWVRVQMGRRTKVGRSLI